AGLADEQAQREQLPAALEQEFSLDAPVAKPSLPWARFLAGWREQEARVKTRLGELQRERDQLIAEQQQLDAERRQLAPLAEAKQQSRWWTGSFWKATLGGNPLPRLEQIAARCRAVDESLENLTRQVDQLSREHQQLIDRRDDER